MISGHNHYVIPRMSNYMGVETTTDDRGRITIPKEFRDRHGERYRIVSLDTGIKLIPIPDDPIDALQEAASEELQAASIAELREAASTEAEEQSGRHVR